MKNPNTLLALIGALLLCGVMLATMPRFTPPSPPPAPRFTSGVTFPFDVSTHAASLDWTSPSFTTSGKMVDVVWNLDCSPGSEPQLFFYTAELGLQFSSFELAGTALEQVTAHARDHQQIHADFAAWQGASELRCSGYVSILEQ